MRGGGLERSRWARVGAGALVAGLVATATHAEPASETPEGVAAVLDWDAPAECPDGAALQQSLGDVLGEPLDFGRLESVRGSIERRASDWALTLELVEQGRRRTRLITARACADLADAAALAIQLARTEESEPPPGPPQSAALTREAIPPAPLDVRPPRERGTSQGVARSSVSAAAVLDLSALSRATPGLSLAGRVTLARFELGLYALALAPVNVNVRAGESARFSLLAAGPRACYRALTAGSLGAKPCIGFELGRFAADGAGLSRDERSFAQWWLAPSAGLALDLALSHWLGVEARGELSRPLLRRTYAVNGSEQVYEPPALGARFDLGVAVQLP